MLEELRFYSKYLALVIAIIALFKYRDYAHTKAKYFLYSVWYIVITEFIGANFYKWFGLYNLPVYNLYTFLQLLFYLWFFRTLIKSDKKKKIATYFILIFIVFSIIDANVIHDFMLESTIYQYALGVIFVVTTICFYFFELFNSEMVLKITASKYFWFSIGILIFHATYLPFYFANKYFLYGDIKPLSIANFVLCFLMYTCFVIGFLKAKKNTDN